MSLPTYPQFVTLLTRLILGPMFLWYGIRKMLDWEQSVRVIRAGFVETWLPIDLVTGYTYVLPVWEALVGALILLGLYYRVGLLLCAALMATLIFGLAVQGNAEVVGRNMIYALALFFAYKHADENPLSIDALLRR